MTPDQQRGLSKLLRMLVEATHFSDGRDSDRRKRLPWLFAESRMQLAFIDGQRGSGKTTLMTTLVSVIDDPKSMTGSDPTDSTFDDVAENARKLHGLVVPVQPLDMEPLPKGTPLLAAILARVYRAANEYVGGRRPPANLLADDPRDHRELLRFQQYRERVSRALDSNLQQRKASLDADQFAEAVMMEEDNRLELVSDLERVLGKLSRQVREQLAPSDTTEHPDSSRLLFLVLIDDIDLNPDRCLELLRLLRTFSPPRELFFLLMGDYERAESIVKLQMAAEYGKLWKDGGSLTSLSEESLRNDLAAISVANVRKMIPPQTRIELPLPSLDSALTFRPLEN